MRRVVALAAGSVLILSLTAGTSGAEDQPTPAPPALSLGATPRGDVVPPDPSAPGPYATKRIDVIRSWASVDVGFPAGVFTKGTPLVEDVSEVTYPVDAEGNVPPGRHPVVLLLHGMHQWCANEGPVVKPVPWWCLDSGSRPVPSYQGYRYLADVLASQGRIVVSISADGVNALDFFSAIVGSSTSGMSARGKLVIHHLRELAAANERRVKGLGTRLVGHVDLDRTVLVGHSRGGEGVVVAGQMLERMANPPASVEGLVNLAPTAFAQSAPPNTPTMTLLPACDGDVADLQGQTYVDRGRDLYGGRGFLRSSVWFAGGNHNFLNTEWTPGMSESDTGKDDATAYDDIEGAGSCRPDVRITPSQERKVGLAYVAAMARWTQDDDQAMLAFLDGTGTVPSSVTSQQVEVRVSSLAGPDRLLTVPQPDTDVSSRGISARLCKGSQLGGTQRAWSDFCAFRRVTSGYDTSWLGIPSLDNPLPGRTAVHLTWERAGSGWLDLGNTRDLSSSTRLSMRVVVDPKTQGTFRMMVRDADGAVAIAPLRGATLQPLTYGKAANRLVPQQAWIDVSDLRGIDLTRVAAAGLVVTGSGGAWILDVSHRTARPAPTADVLPLSTVAPRTIRVPAGTSVVTVPLTLDRPSKVPTRFAVEFYFPEEANAQISGNTIVIPPGRTSIDIPITVTIPSVISPDEQYTGAVGVYPLSGAAPMDNVGLVSIVPEGVTIRTIEIVEPIVEADPGDALAWDFTSSDGSLVTVGLVMVDAYMDYADLDPDFRELQGLPDSGPITSGDGMELWTDVEEVAPGVVRARLPLAKGASRGAWISYRIETVGRALVPKDAPLLRGTVGVGAGIVRRMPVLSR